MNEYICYCFEYTKIDIRNDVTENNGHSLIMENIIKEKKNGTCQCHIKHPKSR